MDASRGMGAVKAGAGAGTTPNPQHSWAPTSDPAPLQPKERHHAPKPPKETPQKTPISLLQEACLRKTTTPLYELISTEGQVHEPTFMYRVTVDRYTGNGSGKSKKTAKHLAAKAALEQMVRDDAWAAWGIPGRSREEALAYLESLLSAMAKDGPARASDKAATVEDINAANTVGKLQERCNQLRWPLPEYVLDETLGQPHQRSYRVSVRIGKLISRSEANSKRAAKRQAAELMLEQIRNLKSQEAFDEDDLANEEAVPGAAYPADLEAELELSASVPLSSCTVTEVIDDSPPSTSLFPAKEPPGLDELLRCDLSQMEPSEDSVTWLRSLTRSKNDPSDPISFHPLRNLSVHGARAAWDEEGGEGVRRLQAVSRMGLRAAGNGELANLESFFGFGLRGDAIRAVQGGRNDGRTISGQEALRLLQLIADQNCVPLKHLPVPHRTQNGQVQCLVQLSTVPVAVCHGTGNSEKEAQYAAAKNALEYLKIMATHAVDVQ